ADGAIAYSPDFGYTVDDRSGNLSSFTGIDEFVGIVSLEGNFIACLHNGNCTCPYCYASNNPTIPGSNPIAIRDGNKREEVTDISLNTPTGTLVFTRAYQQSNQQNSDFQYMGLGWTHNHQIFLTGQPQDISLQPDEIHLHTANGSQVHFTND